MNIDKLLPPKHPLRSKAVWTAILGTALGVYEALADQQGWPKIPEWVYIILGSAGVYSLRAARRPLDWGAGTPAEPAPTAPTVPAPQPRLPDASMSGVSEPLVWTDDRPPAK